MSTTIEWTQRPGTKGETWNPTTGCNKVSQGCKHCYAETMHRRLQAMGVKGYEHDFLDGAQPQPHTLDRPLKWRRPRTVFVNSMSDLFHGNVPYSYIDQVFAVMALCPQHTFLILTKRPERMEEYLRSLEQAAEEHRRTASIPAFTATQVLNFRHVCRGDHYAGVHRAFHRPWPLPNVWLGTSVEDQAAADSRIPHLLRCPAAVRFLSCEPLLGPVSFRWAPWINYEALEWRKKTARINELDALHGHKDLGLQPIDWVIVGGESGHGARPMHPDWARSLRDQCQVARVPFFFKQWGAYCPEPGILHRHRAATTAPDTKYTFPDGTVTYRVGKKAAGRLLDGVEHNDWPVVASEAVPA